MNQKLKLTQGKSKMSIFDHSLEYSSNVRTSIKNIRKNKSAYLQLDFLFASLIFFIFVFSVYAQFDSKIDEFDSRFNSLEIKGYARDICYMLVKTPGYPTNWETADVEDPQYLGLYNPSLNRLDEQKLSALSVSIYRRILDNMNMNAFIRIEVVGMTSGTVYRDFGVINNNALSIFENYVCYSNYNNEQVKVIVGIWR